MTEEELINSLETKVRTTFIGSLQSIELYFGDIWGFEYNTADLTPQEKLARKTWKILRDDILFKGNIQLKAIRPLVEEYLGGSDE